MINRITTPALNMILLIGLSLIVIDVIFFNGGLIFSLLFSFFMIFIGKRKYDRLYGKFLFWLGIISLIISFLSLFVVKLFLVGVFIYIAYKYYEAKKDPDRIKPRINLEKKPAHELPLVKVEPLFKQSIFGDQHTEERSYEWHDINIHGGFGDRTIDLSNTVLPESEAVISIRHFAGKILIYVPYEVEVSIYHSSLFGRAHIFNEHHLKLMNHTISYHTAEYFTQKPQVKIITSIFSGDLEVRRI